MILSKIELKGLRFHQVDNILWRRELSPETYLLYEKGKIYLKMTNYAFNQRQKRQFHPKSIDEIQIIINSFKERKIDKERRKSDVKKYVRLIKQFNRNL